MTLAPRFTLSGLNLAILLTLSHAANDAFTNVLPVFLPIFQERFSLGEAVLASFVAVISLSSNVLQAFMGALADRWGKRRSAALGLIIGSTLMSFIAVVPTVWMLFILLAVGGLGSAIFHPAASSMARNVSAKTGLSMGFFISGGSLGSALMPIVALAIIRNYGTQYVPYLALIGIVIGSLLFVLSPEQTVARGANRPKIFDRDLFFGPVGLLSVVGIMRAITFIGFTNAIPLWLVNIKGFAPDAQIIGWTLATYSISSSIGVMGAGALEHILGRRLLIAGSMLLALPALLVLFLIPPGSVLYFLLVALIGILTNASVPLLVVSAQDLAPHAVATASGMLMGFTWGIAGVLYIGFGALQETIGLTSAMIVSYLFLLPAAFLALWVLRKQTASS
ncbi:MAG: MFS transporter [Trueperaceae bacterium]|nr:MFS transporter [Trueperaceae bacterium]